MVRKIIVHCYEDSIGDQPTVLDRNYKIKWAYIIAVHFFVDGRLNEKVDKLFRKILQQLYGLKSLENMHAIILIYKIQTTHPIKLGCKVVCHSLDL